MPRQLDFVRIPTARPDRCVAAGALGALLLAGVVALAPRSAAAADLGGDDPLGADAGTAAGDLVQNGNVEFPADATYVRSTTNRSGVPLRWMGSNCVFVRANSAGSDDISDGSDLLAIESAVDRWHSATAGCSYMRLNLQEPTADAEPFYDSDGPNESVIAWIESDWPHDAAAAGLTVLFFVDDESSSQDGRILDADIELNGAFRFSTTGDPDATDVENTVVHELGHLLGLDHTCDDGARNPTPKDNRGELIPQCWPVRLLPPRITEATMYNFSDPGETKKRTPELGDVHGVCDIYPPDDDPGVCQRVDLAPARGCDIPGRDDASGGRLAWLLAAIAALSLLFVRRTVVTVRTARTKASVADRR